MTEGKRERVRKGKLMKREMSGEVEGGLRGEVNVKWIRWATCILLAPSISFTAVQFEFPQFLSRLYSRVPLAAFPSIIHPGKSAGVWRVWMGAKPFNRIFLYFEAVKRKGMRRG